MNDTNDTNPLDRFAAFVAVDWADEKHAFSLQAAGQKKKESGTLEQKPELEPFSDELAANLNSSIVCL